MTIKLPIEPIVNVVASISLGGLVRAGFNLGLIIGSSSVITTDERVKVYTSLDEMIEDGFTAASSEYKAAALYFGQTPKPLNLAVGCKGTSETALEAITACRQVNTDWYPAVLLDTDAEADILAVAEYIESATPESTLFFTTNDETALDNSATNIFGKLKPKGYNKTLGMYSATPNAVVSIMGYAMGANTKTNNSAYTLAYKSLPGVDTDALSQAQVANVKKNNGNIYVQRGGTYNVFEPGVMASGLFFDEVLCVAMFTDELQRAVFDQLTSTAKVPQTEAGMTEIINVINQSCTRYIDFGFIAPGVWNGPKILELNHGDSLPKGFLVQSESIDKQSTTDRAARKAPPIYVAAKLSGAIQYVTIQLNISR